MVKTPQITPEWDTGIYIGNGVVAKRNNFGGFSPKDRKRFLQHVLSILGEVTVAAEEMNYHDIVSATNICEDTIIKEIARFNQQFQKERFPHLYGEALHSDEEDV